MIRSFINLLIQRSRTTLSMLILVFVAGIYAYRNMPVEASPDIAIPYISIAVALEGVSPEDGVRLLIKPTEVELRTIDGVKEITARALENYVNVVVEFNPDININDALADVRAAVDRARDKYPDDAKEPIIKELTANEFPAFVVSLVGNGIQERVLYNHAMALKRKIQSSPDVLEARLRGHREEVLEAIIDRNKLEVYGISSLELIKAVSSNNLLVPAGDIDTGYGRFSVKLPGLIESHQDLYNMPLRASSNAMIKLGDVAEIRRTFKDSEGITLVDGQQAISIEVDKRSGANTIKVVRNIKLIMKEYENELPDGIEMHATFDESPFLLQMVEELQGNILAGLILVLVIVVASLGLRSALLVSFGIPVAALGGIFFIYIMGYSFNFMVLFGLLLTIGMIVDGAIVITEYADCKMTEGMSPKDAYIEATDRMFVPATSSMLTTLAAFLPLIFWPGVSGQFMRILPMTAFAILTWSLIFALIFLPVMGALFGKRENDNELTKNAQALEHDDPCQLKNWTGSYARFIRKILEKPATSLGSSILILITIFIAYAKFNSGSVYFTQAEHNFGEVNVSARGNLSAQESIDLVREVEKIVRSTPDVESVYTTAYPVGTAQNRRTATEDEIGHMVVRLVGQDHRKKTSDEIFWDIRKRTEHLSGIRIYAAQMQDGPPVTKDIHIELTSDNQSLLQQEAKRIRQYLQTDVEGLIDIDDTLPLPGIEWELRVDRTQAALNGASVADVGLAVQMVTNGVLVGKYRPDDADDEVDIRVRYPIEDRNIESLDYLTVATPTGATPISNFVVRSPKPRVNKLQRMNGTGVASVYANAAFGILPNDKIAEVQKWLNNEANISSAVTVKFRGAEESQEEATKFLGIAFLLALLLMMTLLLAQFNSFYQTLLVLTSIIMSTAGVFLGHMIFSQPFSIILGGMGIVALAGVIVNNNIILLDTYNHIRVHQPNLHYTEMAIRTGAQRLRPVFLTAITAGLGLIPLALGISTDILGREITTRGTVASYWKPLASSLVYGLAFGTILTLVITPLLMVFPDYLREQWNQRKKYGN